MSYSYENLAIDKTKINCIQKCFYLINLIKSKSPEKWEELKPKFDTLKPEESWDFYQHLVQEYKILLQGPSPKAQKKVNKAKPAPKKAAVKKAKPKTAAKAPAKKSKAKPKPAKKSAKKKVTKKPTKKK